jgi:DNA helicase II / ATP-dependent DNA helicase PcrA
MEHLQTLNEAQKKAATTTEGPVLVLAGAGAGKTKTIAHRIVHLVKGGVAPEQILAITFTNKAAREMRDRVFGILREHSNAPGLPTVSTFHALSAQLLREFSGHLGLPRHFAIADRADATRAIKQALKTLGHDEKTYAPRMVLSVISKEKAKGVKVAAFKERVSNDYAPRSAVVADLWEAYERTLRAQHTLDFDDLLLFLSQLLSEQSEVRELLQERWQYVHIDEYQDTNVVQYDIARMLAGERANLFCVGDVDQCVYSWRNATLRNILDFEKDFKGASVLRLEQNYRSTGTIISASNNVIKHNKRRKEKTLFTEAEAGEKISLLIGYNEQDEARRIAETLREHIASGTNPSDIAVLYRTNFQSRALEDACLRAGVPYRVLGTRFFDRAEVKDTLAYLRAAQNRQDTIALTRCINTPARGIGEKTVETLLSHGVDMLPARSRGKVEHVFAILDGIAQAAMHQRPSEVLRHIVRASGMETVFETGGEEGQERLANVFELIALAESRYDEQTDGLSRLLEDAALATDQDELDTAQLRRSDIQSCEGESGAVGLMTVHAAKGLEFGVVVVSGMEEGLFPQVRTWGGAEGDHDSEEERRLFYVALTRAKKKVYLSYALSRTVFGSRNNCMPSSFLEEIGEEHFEAHESAGEAPTKTVYLD